MTLPPYTFAAAFGRWTWNGPVAVALALVALGYVALTVKARRRGVGWPWWRAALFIVVGLGSVVLCTMSSLAVYQHVVLWALAAQLTLLISIVPVCLALGDPVGLVRAALADPARQRFDAVLAGPVVRVLTFPLVAAVLALVTMLVVFLSGLLGAALRSGAVMDLVYLGVLVVGCLLALPLLGAEMLPAWCTEPFRLLFASVDGLLDAIPGIVVMTTGSVLADGYYAHAARPAWTPDVLHDEHIAGALMLALTEVVSLPLVIILFFRWARDETRRDARAARTPTPVVAGEPAPPEEPATERPWWETEGHGRRTDEFRPKRR